MRSSCQHRLTCQQNTVIQIPDEIQSLLNCHGIVCNTITFCTEVAHIDSPRPIRCIYCELA